MKISVELPQPIKLNQDDRIELFLHDAGGDFITVHGDGSVSYQGNGGNAPQFRLNLGIIAEDIRANLR